MATAKTDFSISANVVTDTSQVQKTLNQQRFIIRADIRTNDAEQSIQRLNNLTRNTSQLFQNGFERINTTIKTGQTGFDAYGNRLQNLTKYTETFKNAIGDVQQRITVMTERGQILSSSTQRIANGIANIATETRTTTQAINGLENKITVVSKTMTDTAGNTQTVIERTREWTDASGRLNKEITTTNERGEQLAPTITTVSDATTKASNSANKASTATKNLGESAERANYGVKNLGWSLGDAISRLTNFYVASLPIRAVQTMIVESITTVKEFDSALIEFKKVSDLAGESLTRYVAKLAEMGEVTGSTMQAMVEASTEFRKSGFNDEDSAKLASIAEKYRNIADEEISAGESASFIIAQMKAFNIEAEQAEHIIDSVNEVANNFSVSSADLATNLGNMSEIMAINNVSMEQQIGMLTGVTEITRNASSASRGLVMISSRLTQVLDDSSSTGKKLTKIYKDLGIELKDENGQLRSHYDILGDLAKQWDSLGENQQKYIALTSAGARQQQNFVALMDNWSQVISATSKAYDSMGSAQKENAKVMDSIEKKTQILKSEFQKLIIGKGGLQDANKTILDLGIALLKLANTPVGKITLEIALLTAGVVGLTTAIHSLTVAMATNPLLLLVTALSAVVVVAIEVANAEDEMTRAHRENIEAVQQAQEEYDSLVSEIDKLKQRLDDIKDEKINISDENDLRILEEEEASLRRQVELLEAKAEIERKSAEKTAKAELETTYTFVGTDGNAQELKRTEAITAQKKMLEELSAEYDELDKKETQQTVDLSKMSDTGSKAYRDLEESIKNTTKEKEKLGHQIEETESGFRDFLQETEELGEALTSTDKETVQLKEDLFEGVEEGLKYFNEKSLAVIKDQLRQFSEGGNVDLTLRPRIDAEELNKAGYEAGEGVATVFTHTFTNEANDIAMNFTPIMVDPETGEYLGVMKKDEFEKYCEDVVNGVREDDLNLKIGVDFKKEEHEDFLQLAEEEAETIHELHEAEDELTTSVDAYNSEAEEEVKANEDIQDSIQELAETLGITATELLGLSERFDDLTLETFLSQLVEARQEISDTSTVIDNLQEALETASGALEEYNENGYLTLDTFQSLMGISAQYLAALINENGQLEINQTTLGNLVEQLKIAKIEELQTAAAMEIAANHTDDARIASVNAQGAVQNIGNAIATTGDKAATAAGKVAGFAATVATLSGVSQKDWTSADKAIVNKYKNLAKEISQITINTTAAGNAATKAGRKGSGAAKSAKDATKELNKELEETKSKYDKVITWIKKQYDKKTDALKDAKDAATDAIEKEIKALEKEKDTILDGIEKETDALEKEKDVREKYWDDQIDALKKANQEKKDALELQEKLDALEKARNTKVKIYKEGQGFVYDIDQTAVAEAQKALDEYLSEKAYEDELARLEALKDAEMDNYDKRIDALNDYKDKVSASYEEQISALEDHKAALEEQYDAEIEMYNNYKQQFEDMVNAYQEEQDRLLAQQLLGINLESDNWMTRLDNLAEFVNKYNALQKQLDTGNTSTSNDASMKTGGGDGGSFDGGLSSSTKRTVSNYSKPKDSRDYTPDYSTKTTPQQREYQARVKHLGKTYASGASSIKDDEIAVVGENPNKEIVIGSKLNNGELMSLNKGSGVVNAESSSTLAGMLNQVGKFGASGFGSGNGTLNSNINNDTLTINGVTIQGSDIKDPQTFVNGLLNLKAEALQRAYKHR